MLCKGNKIEKILHQTAFQESFNSLAEIKNDYYYPQKENNDSIN